MRIIEKTEKFYLKYYRDIEKSRNIVEMIYLYYVLMFIEIFLNESNIYIRITFKIFELVIIIWLYIDMNKKKYWKIEESWTKRNLNLKEFMSILSLIISKGLISNIIIKIVYAIKGTTNVIIPGTVADSGTSLDTIIIAVIIAPIIEELIFRGVGLNLFGKSDNKLEAVIFTAIIFGLAHGNLSQAINSIIGGCIYGYVTIEFGIIFSIILHMINNAIVFINYFLNIETLMEFVYILILLMWFYKRKEVIRKIKVCLNSKKQFSIKRQLVYFLNPTIFLLIIFWILEMIISI